LRDSTLGLEKFTAVQKLSPVKKVGIRSKMTLNYRMMVERYPNPKEEVGGSNPGCEISSLPDGKLARWSTASCALELAFWPSLSKKKEIKR
jgi:hypothetical protein